jgi:aryl-alcohol dehydrogenase-like predicted oxidoreductase
MRYRTLGATGIQVTPYCLGAMMFGSIGNPDPDDSIRIIHRALDAGINFIDTADMYSRGESELIVGNALNGRRDNVVVATKVNGPMGEDPNMRGTSRRWIITAVEDPCAGCRPSISISTRPAGWTRRSTRRRPFRP